MNKILQQAHKWMQEYMKSFYEDDKDVMLGIRTKEIHTGYVTDNMISLAKHLQLSEHDIQLAELMGLFHDVGRFRQWLLYRSFADAKTEDHANLGLKVIAELPFLKMLPEEDRDLLIFAIGNHNKKVIAPAPDKRHSLFAKMLRDADKLDIYRVLEPYLVTTKEIGDASKFITVSEDDRFADGFLDRFINAEQVDYNMIETQNDRRLVRLMWVYDVNFSWTLQRIKQRGYIEKIVESLPKVEKVITGVERLNNYVTNKCNSADLPLDL